MLVTLRKKSVLIAFVVILNGLMPVYAAKDFYPLITYKCDPEADILTITNSLLRGEAGASFDYSAENGTYSPWDMVETARLTDTTRIIKSSKVTNACTLSNGDYTVVLEPQIFSKDLNGQCGSTISGAVTVIFDNNDLLERTAFEDFCHGNAPVITRITVFGKTGDYKIKRIPKYKFY